MISLPDKWDSFIFSLRRFARFKPNKWKSIERIVYSRQQSLYQLSMSRRVYSGIVGHYLIWRTRIINQVMEPYISRMFNKGNIRVKDMVSLIKK